MLEFREQTLLFWRFVHYLVVEQQYRLIKLDKDDEVWLQPPVSRGKKAADYIRLIRKDIDWGNSISKDIEQLKYRLRQLHGNMFSKKAKVINIYITTYPPVDEWKDRIKPQNGIRSYLIDKDHRDEEMNNVFKQLQLTQPSTGDWVNGEDETIEEVALEVKQTVQQREKEIKNMVSFGKPLFTFTILMINVLVFFLEEFMGGSTNPSVLILLGAKFNPLIIDGEWWRFFTPMLLHIGFLHLFMNSLALFYLGSLVERMYGSVRFVFIYIMAGTAGSIASFVFNDQVSAGASGAIFGCFGALLYFGVINSTLFFRTMGMNVIVVLVINLMFGFAVPMIDNSGHIGGLVGGFLAAAAVNLPKRRSFFIQLGSIIVLIIGIIGMLNVGYSAGNQKGDPMAAAQAATYYIEQGEVEKAYNLLLPHVENNSSDLNMEVLFLLSFTEIKLQKYESAIRNLETVIAQDPDFHEAFYNLALVYAEIGEIQKARASIEKALAIKPNNNQYQEIYDELITQ